MNITFFRYFFSYIFKAKTRQKLIFLTIIGLLISAFSLTVLQGIMGGLQSGLVQRSKNVLGLGSIELIDMQTNDESYLQLVDKLQQEQINFVPELELELMIQHESYVSPIILHGLDYNYLVPNFLKNKDKADLVIGSDLASSLRVFFSGKVKVTSPAHTDFVFGDIPRQSVSGVSDFASSELPEIDSVHGWINISFLHNLIRSYQINKLRIYDGDLDLVLGIIKDQSNSNITFRSWEQENSTLVWALNLETRMMLFLFIAMSVLIGICITSGFLIFYNKIKGDLASFWMLGLPKAKIMTQVYLLGQGISIIFCSLGVGLGLLFLWLIDSGNFIIMPEQFVERNIPVNFDLTSILLSFFVPYLVASIFTHITFKVFKKEDTSFLAFVRKIG